jgi:hypothetical protein
VAGYPRAADRAQTRPPGWHTVSILTESLPSPLNRFRIDRVDPFRIAIVAVLLIVALFVWSAVRDRVVTPLDSMVTERLCTDHGEEIGRTMLAFERSNRFGLTDRSVGYCFYGEGPNGEAAITLAIEQLDPGRLYLAAKWIGIIIQLGVVSIFLRLTIDPALDFYRYVRSTIS